MTAKTSLVLVLSMAKIKVSFNLNRQLEALKTKLGNANSTLPYFLGAGNRLRMQQLQQADWIAQQIREKQQFKDQ